MNSIGTALSFAISAGNTKRQSHALMNLAGIKWQLGDYAAGQIQACEAKRLAQISADLWSEALALRIEASCWRSLGNYKHAFSLCKNARKLLGLCGLVGGGLDLTIMSSEGEIHNFRSEYVETLNIQKQILSKISVEQDPYNHAFALLNIADIGVMMGASKHVVEKNIDIAKSIFKTVGYSMEVLICDAILADLYLREGNMLTAQTLFEKCLSSFWRNHIEMATYCLERLSNVSRWSAMDWPTSWTMVYLVHALKFEQKLDIHKALQFLGDVFQAEGDQGTAISLFTIALDGFTNMDIHRSRAECMLCLGDISQGNGDWLKAVQLWMAARPLFERSSQAKQVAVIDEKLAIISGDVLEGDGKSLVSQSSMHLLQPWGSSLSKPNPEVWKKVEREII